ncbi:hypothetical protein VF14_16385 [Nostoc linckia z18]|jgi:hypothetical protein|uniref:Uncharacterized protein n=2 Tax=Nostoc linckia TaxID=92942 RepID=A0A9Q6EKH7_NOSLI|nr:hypothetical protein [Nostoc linckia]PHK39579.1 hypothetical protein VF12_13785 [Nostoc linckia z15]PHK44956.1 hypothetical protein VF13_18975 [Nostoc linckia z16]PHJ66145.1 hypothetical protein VF05_19790 [Nostoc linckia z3]PHJ68739.1 hypothetical protein VF02_02360 [Nostoc linckia z1]PHJ74049.1 hypothetical protein VF03_15540 [Nostoc linckia z2]
MSIPNEREIKNSEVRQETYTGTNGNTHTHLTRTTETVNNNATNPNSYQNGYVQGRNAERRYQEVNLAERDDNNTSNGLLMGIIITSLAGLIVGGLWYFNQANNAAVDNSAPVTTPAPSNSTATPTESPQPQTTIIERTREVPVPVPVPQQQAVPPSAPPQPDINITVPPQQTAPSGTQPTPNATQGQTTSPSTNTPTSQNDSSTNTATPDTQGDNSKVTTPQGIEQPNTTSNSSSTGNSAQ